MANNIAVLDGAGNSQTVKSTDTASVHVPHHNVDAIIAGTGATNLGKAEDAAHTTGDTGVMTLAVRRDADTSECTTTADYTPLLVDEVGFLKVRGRRSITILPTMGTQTSGAYSDNDFVGGKLTLSNIVPIAGGSGVIHVAKIFSKSPQTALYDVVFFSADPSGSTITDNAAASGGGIVDADLTKIIGVAHCTDVTDLGTSSVAMAVNLGLPFELASGTTAYACVIARDAITQTSTSDMVLAVGVLPD